jgi:hypothetical protein
MPKSLEKDKRSSLLGKFVNKGRINFYKLGPGCKVLIEVKENSVLIVGRSTRVVRPGSNVIKFFTAVIYDFS